MAYNIFFENKKTTSLNDYLNYNQNSRENLGADLPVLVYRMLEYSMKEELRKRFGRDEQIDIFRSAGYMAGEYFANNYLNLDEPLEQFVKQLQTLIWHSKGDVLIISVDNPRILYASNNNITSEKKQELYNIFINKTHEFNFLERKMLSDNSYIWEVEDSERNFYRITTNNITWQQESAYANIIFDITEEKLAKSELEYKAYFDRLTKIGNRYYFYARVNDLLRLHESLIFCYCDLDHLKYINDNYGHNEGDKYLCSFVNTINDIIREDDMFARIGGDEFCIILRNCSKQDAYNKLEKAQKEFVSNNNEVYSKNFSFGIVSLPENHGIVNIDTVIHEADNSMYEQKKLHKQLDKQKSE